MTLGLLIATSIRQIAASRLAVVARTVLFLPQVIPLVAAVGFHKDLIHTLTIKAVDRTGKLALASRPNQDTPLMDGGRVLIGNDVWEHAYYLKYQNRRPDYLSAWWNVVNWDRVAARYAAAKAGSLII